MSHARAEQARSTAAASESSVRWATRVARALASAAAPIGGAASWRFGTPPSRARFARSRSSKRRIASSSAALCFRFACCVGCCCAPPRWAMDRPAPVVGSTAPTRGVGSTASSSSSSSSSSSPGSKRPGAMATASRTFLASSKRPHSPPTAAVRASRAPGTFRTAAASFAAPSESWTQWDASFARPSRAKSALWSFFFSAPPWAATAADSDARTVFDDNNRALGGPGKDARALTRDRALSTRPPDNKEDLSSSLRALARTTAQAWTAPASATAFARCWEDSARAPRATRAASATVGDRSGAPSWVARATLARSARARAAGECKATASRVASRPRTQAAARDAAAFSTASKDRARARLALAACFKEASSATTPLARARPRPAAPFARSRSSSPPWA
mmetsp:Transcript_34205/g.109849  ORF Transcript_34205/g.109849 Transcript_34205/m.109849 type:complete len:395 (+) Transcript_34205:2872-4056(+)